MLQIFMHLLLKIMCETNNILANVALWTKVECNADNSVFISESAVRLTVNVCGFVFMLAQHSTIALQFNFISCHGGIQFFSSFQLN